MTYYVSTAGNNANPGTFAQPWRTISYAIGGASALAPGDTLLVRGGTYSEVLATFINGTNWTIGSGAIYIAAYQNEIVWVQPPAGNNAVVMVGVSNYIVENIGVDGVNLTGTADAMVYIGNSDHIRWTGSTRQRPTEFKNAYWSGCEVTGGSTYVQLLKLKIYDGGRVGTGGAGAHGIYQGGTHGVDAHNLFQDVEVYGFTGRSDDAGIQVYSGDPFNRAHGITIDRLKSHGNQVGLSLSNSHGGILVKNTLIFGNLNGGIICYYDIDDCLIYNCTVDGNIGWGTEVGTGGLSLNNLFKNTAFTNNTAGPGIIYNTDPATKASFLSNDRNGNGNGNVFNDMNGLSTFTGNLTVAPGYVDQPGGDYRITNASGLRNAGLTLVDVPLDYDELVRPQDVAYCIGAHEYPRSNFLMVF